MSLRTTISMVQKPMLVMTPKLQQAIKILQMHRLELTQYISQQMVENPVLEESYDEIEETDAESENEDEVGASEDEIPEVDLDLETGLPDTEVPSESDSPETDITDDDFGDVDWEKYFDDTAPNRSNEWEAPLDEDTRDNREAPEESLEEHLLWQLRMSAVSEDDCAIGEAIVGNIDSDGYLTTDVEEIAEMMEQNVAEVERVLTIIQAFDPSGVGARDLRECLLIQLRQLGLEDTIAYDIVEKDYLKDLEANRFPQIAKKLKTSLELVREAIDAISALEPKPGCQFSSIKPEYVVPDVTVEEVDGVYRVFANDYGPRLRLSPYYRGMLNSQDSLPNETREYIRSKIQSASWLLESIERRRRTILRVTESIFQVQRDFLESGPSHLKPLTLREIADMVGVHEATVSRVTRNRYVQTPQGVFELKFFFNSGILTESGRMTSSASVKEMLKNIVDNEDSESPLSDNDIEVQLNQKGIKIARRTIAKYRGELNIPPSSKRRKW